MEVLSVIMSGLALLAAMASFTLWIREKKRSQKQRDAMLQLISMEKRAAVIECNKYSDTAMSECASNMVLIAKKHTDIEVKKVHTKTDCLRKDLDTMSAEMAEMEKHVNDLLSGVVPDYEEAVKAKDAVNSFSRDIAAILNFDPLQAAKETRLRNRSGQEVE